ncbi:hypothetical protein [Sigmofec virus UA08Rod_6219]|uniref:Uncharacterized protein n=1 Tax=Sigmofec virus UA08Rod_6219 TaxID=2929225 RepID=A0A976N0R3_9VIRU|nr:hypothetical protein [Sigmofec virus UA08Rod_6219]
MIDFLRDFFTDPSNWVSLGLIFLSDVFLFIRSRRTKNDKQLLDRVSQLLDIIKSFGSSGEDDKGGGFNG